MKELLIVCLIVLVMYLYKSYYDIDNAINDLRKENAKMKVEIENLKKDIFVWKVRQVNWYSQLETAESDTNEIIGEITNERDDWKINL